MAKLKNAELPMINVPRPSPPTRWTAYLLAGCLLGTCGPLAPALAQTRMVNGVAVLVNDAVITFKDVQRQIADQMELLMTQYRNQPRVLEDKANALQADAVEQLVERELILHEFENGGYVLPESIVNEVVQERIKERFGDRVTLTKTLHQRGMTFEDFRKKVREDFIVEQMRLKNVSQELIISPYKIESYYVENREKFKLGDQVKLRMIVIDKSRYGAESAKSIAEEIVAKIKQGADFAEMAAVYSDGSQRSEGGNWGWVEKSVLREDLAGIAFQMEPGEMSGLIDRPEGVYIMNVEQKRPHHIQSLSEVRDEIEQTLEARERSRLQNQWIDKLKEKAFIRYY